MVTAAEVAEMSESLEHVYVAPALRSYLLDLAEATRRHTSLALGLSPRGILALQRVSRAQAGAPGAAPPPPTMSLLARVVIPASARHPRGADARRPSGRRGDRDPRRGAGAPTRVDLTCPPAPAGPSWRVARCCSSRAGWSAGSSSSYRGPPPWSQCWVRWRSAPPPIPDRHPQGS
ncbi:MAG: hypothetical protein R2695_15960 [Acidimicrobiales bacterium]